MLKKIKIIPLSLISILILSATLPTVYALTGTYQFTSNENSNKQLEDTFTYRDDCFQRSSFLGCSHLEILSAQVAEASASWYGDSEDQYEIDYSNNSHNITKMLQDMEFEDVSTNKYYTLEKEQNSAGVAVGKKTITVDNKNYTLLAIIPRSAGYKQEWAGNFTVGDGSIHEGFKAARDEILRYVKQYITNNNIQGDLKIWTAGHSRGAALANMIGAFFAGGGIEYFGNSVSITPEDVYCYTYATPRTIKDGADKNIELSVAGNRTDANYVNDTPGEAFNYTKGGTVNVKSEIYGGIRNLISASDIFTMLPPETWGFTHYGNDIPANHSVVTEDAMLEELQKISQYAYNEYINGGNPNSFERKTFDLKTLSIVKDNNNYSAMDISTLLKERLNGLVFKAKTNKIYKDQNYQEMLKAIAGTYGLSMTLFEDDFLEDTDGLIEPLIYSYLAYASSRLQEEGKASNETEAVTLVLEDLLSYFTGENINKETFTFDDFIQLLAKYIGENENEPIADTLVSGIVSIIPEDYATFLDSFKQFAKSTDTATQEEGLKAFVKACYYGPDPESEASSYVADAEATRTLLYGLIYFALGTDHPEITTVLLDASYSLNGKGEFKNFVQVLLGILKTVKDEDGNVIKTYSTLEEMADDKLVETINTVFENPIEKAGSLYGSDYKNALTNYINTIKSNISQIREVLLYALLYENGAYNVENDIKNLTTFLGNAPIIPLAHYNEIYLAYAKASLNFDCGYEDHTIQEEKNEANDENGVSPNDSSENAESTSKSKTPKTGDNIIIWITLSIISLIGCVALIIALRKSKK